MPQRNQRQRPARLLATGARTALVERPFAGKGRQAMDAEMTADTARLQDAVTQTAG